MPITIQAPVTINDVHLQEILNDASSACYGWVARMRESAQPNGDTKTIKLFASDNDGLPDGEELTVTLSTIERGIQVLSELAIRHEWAQRHLGNLLRDVTGDCMYCAMDVGTTDVIVQLGLFGELVYG